MHNYEKYEVYFTSSALENLHIYTESFLVECNKFDIIDEEQTRILDDLYKYSASLAINHTVQKIDDTILASLLFQVGSPAELLFSIGLLNKCIKCSVLNSANNLSCINCGTAISQSACYDRLTELVDGTRLESIHQKLLFNKYLLFFTAILFGIFITLGFRWNYVITGYGSGYFMLILNTKKAEVRSKLDELWSFYRKYFLKGILLVFFSITIVTYTLYPNLTSTQFFSQIPVVISSILLFSLIFWVFLPESQNRQFFRFLLKMRNHQKLFEKLISIEISFFLFLISFLFFCNDCRPYFSKL